MEGLPRDGRHGQPHEPSRLRISDEDRHKVAEVLRQAAGEGRIDLEELDQRLGATYAAKTYGELVPITADLPAHAVERQLPLAPRPVSAPVDGLTSYSSSVSIMSDCTRRGAWLLPEQHTAFSLMGAVTLDLREAAFAAREVTITANAVMAGIDIIVNPYTRVLVEGIGIMGDFSESRSRVAAELTADSPLVRVKGMALMAGVTVKRKAMPGDPRKRLGRLRP